ncbi:MAG: hypothetical protein WC659_06020 [Patescibacteria group bacterium]
MDMSNVWSDERFTEVVGRPYMFFVPAMFAGAESGIGVVKTNRAELAELQSEISYHNGSCHFARVFTAVCVDGKVLQSPQWLITESSDDQNCHITQRGNWLKAWGDPGRIRFVIEFWRRYEQRQNYDEDRDMMVWMKELTQSIVIHVFTDEDMALLTA